MRGVEALSRAALRELGATDSPLSLDVAPVGVGDRTYTATTVDNIANYVDSDGPVAIATLLNGARRSVRAREPRVWEGGPLIG